MIELLSQKCASSLALLYVAEHLNRLFAESSAAFWPEVEPFQQWDALAQLIVDNRDDLLQKIGVHLRPAPKNIMVNGEPVPANPMHGRIGDHPLFAMLCADHKIKIPRRRVEYGSLQMQILHARWLEAEKVADQSGITPLEILQKEDPHGSRCLRRTVDIALAIRRMSNQNFGDLVEDLHPICRPDVFKEQFPKLKRRPGPDYGSHYNAIYYLLFGSYGAREGKEHSSGTHVPFLPKYPEFIEYGKHYLGVPRTAPGKAEPVQQEALQTTSKSAIEALQLGLHPSEVTYGDILIKARVPGTKSGAKEASEVAHSKARSFEIERRLYPWSSDKARLEDFRAGILPALAAISADPTKPCPNLAIATLVAISIETGRSIEEALRLHVESTPDADFSFQPPPSIDEGCGTWYWQPIQPHYAKFLDVPSELDWPRPNYLRYRASRLVTALIQKHCRAEKIRSRKLFREDLNYEAAVAKWIKKRDPSGACTPRNLSRLRWGILHELTGGELASACLLLGIHDYLASVELHYAVLGTNEAATLFNRSAKTLWGEHDPNSGCESEMYPGDQEKIVGIRAYPRPEVVQGVVGKLMQGSEDFFHLNLRRFDPRVHCEILNRAVLYLVWHQFFTFATRAICDAYQPAALFSADRKLSILSDKDFKDKHKARLIWADDRLLGHMTAMEERLARVRAKLPDCEFPQDSPVWFLSSEGGEIAAQSVTPKAIEEQLKEEFPFPVNTPRKIMRHRLRLAGLTHEEAETYMGHWWESREPWSPFSSFSWAAYLKKLETSVPQIVRELGFTWVPGERKK